MGERTDYSDLIELRLHRQDALHGTAEARAAVVEVVEALPDDPAQSRLFMLADAVSLADVLWETLPGGTIDALLIELMQRRASVLRVGLLSLDELAGLERVRQREDTDDGSRRPTDRTEGVGAGVDTLLGVESEGERVDAPWVESRHDWGDPARCRYWWQGMRCRWGLFHDEIEHPHAP